MSDNILFNNLVKKAPKVAPPQDRPIVDVPKVAIEAFTRLVGAVAVLEIAEARKEAEEVVVKSTMLDAFIEALYKNGTQPPNPKLNVDQDGKPDMAGIFQVQQRYKFVMPDEVNDDTTATVRLIHALKEAGLPEANAQKLVEAEIDAEPLVTLRPFNELVNGHYEGEGKNKAFVEASDKQKAVGQKLLEYVSGISSNPLTEEERELVLVVSERIKVKTNFLSRLKNYCDCVEHAKAILHIIQPTHFVSHMKYGLSDTPEQRQERLVEIAGELIGFTVEETITKAA